MRSLRQTCEYFIVQLITSQLKARKGSLGWVVSFNDWVDQMKLDSLRLWLFILPVGMVQSIMETAMMHFNQARDRDLLLCILTISINSRTTRFCLPQTLKMDEGSRLYVLQLLKKQEYVASLQTFCCDCYREGSVFYMSDQVSNS